MKKLITLSLFLCALGVYAQDKLVQNNISGMLEHNQGQIIDLAEAFGEDQFDWKPAEGIRSVGETIMHVASANYYIAMKMGFNPPEGVDIMTMESIKGKENIIEAFKKSAAFVREKINMVETDAFAEEVDLGFAKLSTLSSILVLLEHNGEHKGQLIAYARSNGVIPPWSN